MNIAFNIGFHVLNCLKKQLLHDLTCFVSCLLFIMSKIINKNSKLIENEFQLDWEFYQMENRA